MISVGYTCLQKYKNNKTEKKDKMLFILEYSLKINVGMFTVGIEYYLEMSLWLKETHMALHSLAIAKIIKLSRSENCN